MSTIHVACAANAAYAPYCAAMLHSLLRQHPGNECHIHFLHGTGVNPDYCRALTGMVDRGGGAITFPTVEERAIGGLQGIGRFPPLVWYRVLLPQLLPDLERVVYLDADTLVVDRLDDLWQTPLDEHHIAAVANVLDDAASHDYVRALGVNPADYFNSGVLLMNLDKLRQDRCSEAIRAYGVARGSALTFPDQDSLNAVLAHRRLHLHPRWNCQNTLFFCRDRAARSFGAAAVAEALRRPAILHFEGENVCKPWHYISRHPYRHQYWEHLRATGLPVPPLEGLTVKNMVIKHTQWIPDPPRLKLYRMFSRFVDAVSGN